MGSSGLGHFAPLNYAISSRTSCSSEDLHAKRPRVSLQPRQGEPWQGAGRYTVAASVQPPASATHSRSTTRRSAAAAAGRGTAPGVEVGPGMSAGPAVRRERRRLDRRKPRRCWLGPGGPGGPGDSGSPYEEKSRQGASLGCPLSLHFHPAAIRSAWSAWTTWTEPHVCWVLAAAPGPELDQPGPRAREITKSGVALAPARLRPAHPPAALHGVSTSGHS